MRRSSRGSDVCALVMPSPEVSVSLAPVLSNVGSLAVASGNGEDAIWQCDVVPEGVTDGGGVASGGDVLMVSTGSGCNMGASSVLGDSRVDGMLGVTRGVFDTGSVTHGAGVRVSSDCSGCSRNLTCGEVRVLV